MRTCPSCGSPLVFETEHARAEDCVRSLVRRVAALEAAQPVFVPFRVEPTWYPAPGWQPAPGWNPNGVVQPLTVGQPFLEGQTYTVPTKTGTTTSTS